MKMRASPHTVNILEWKFQEGLVEYLEALKWMETRVKTIQNKEDRECVWLLEHPPLYTLGTRGHVEDILVPDKLPLFKVGRGGQATYHGPGQRMIYLMLDLTTRFQDIRRYVCMLEEWMIETLAHFGVKGERRLGKIGIWVQKGGQDHKIAALGVRVQKWVTSHGMALNVSTDLRAYQDIVPCGLRQCGITSLIDLGVSATLQDVDDVLRKTFPFTCISIEGSAP